MVIFILIYIWNFSKKDKKNIIKKETKTNLLITKKIQKQNKAKKILQFSKARKKEENNNENLNTEENTPKTKIETNISFIIDNFSSLEAPTTEKGKIAFDKMQKILKADPEESFNKLKETIRKHRDELINREIAYCNELTTHLEIITETLEVNTKVKEDNFMILCKKLTI